MTGKQENLRKKAKFLKWQKGIDYLEMADAIGMNRNSFYNFISNEEINLGYQKTQSLKKFIERRCNNE